jgi:hypothetical protein
VGAQHRPGAEVEQRRDAAQMAQNATPGSRPRNGARVPNGASISIAVSAASGATSAPQLPSTVRKAKAGKMPMAKLIAEHESTQFKAVSL